MINEIRDFISDCPLLSGRLININHLGSTIGSVSLDAVSQNKKIKDYTDGEQLCRAVFALAIRESFSQSVTANSNAAAFFEGFSQWLTTRNRTENLPTLCGSLTAVSIMPTDGYSIKALSNASARYEMTFEVHYYQAI